LQSLIPYASFFLQMVARKLTAPDPFSTGGLKLWIHVLSLLFLGIHFAASAGEFQGVPLPEKTNIVLAVAGEGVQIYESKANSAGAYQWVLKAPEAALKSLTGEVLGKHFGGPAWSLNDGSQLVGSLPPLKTVPAPDGRNIPWLLVAEKSRSDTGFLSKIDYVVRIATSGGVAPEQAPKSQADTIRVDYRAIYLFLRKQ
jgi:hypothetical protein